MKQATLLLVWLLWANTIWAQEYFQQEVDYKITVTLQDETHELHANMDMTYINHSPDDLAFIYMHLWPNAYQHNTALEKQLFRNGKSSDWFDLEHRRGGIDSLDFRVDGNKVKWEYDPEHKDICKIILNKPLKSGQHITISTPFRVKIPEGITSRLGHIGESYQITQWYPKPAVYDRYGWHQMPYLNQGEFYSEFGSFDVSISLPKNYVVGATGDLQNAEEIAWLNKLADKTAKIDSFDRKDEIFPVSEKTIKTISYIQKDVHDFAWFADKRFHVLKSEVVLPKSKRKVTTWAMFLNSDAKLWLRANEYINDAVYYYSKWNGDYPYKHCTAVLSALSAGGGMEYPNITVIGRSQTALGLEQVIMHEVGHNWYYGILGFNERDYTWMDEGINSFAEARYMRTKYPIDNSFIKTLGIPEKYSLFFDLDEVRYKDMQLIAYLAVARLNKDQHASLHANDFTGTNYGMIGYMKSARIIDYLLAYMGEEKFNAAMHDFYEQWKYKHPHPVDMRKVFEKHTKTDLAWLFDDLIQTRHRVDYKIKRSKNGKVLVKNNGAVASPVSISGITDTNTLYTIWNEGFVGSKWLDLPTDQSPKILRIDANRDMIEFNESNNMLKTSGVLRKIEPIRFKLLGLLESPERTQINFVPTMGWNDHNKYMLGALFYNSPLPAQVFEYQLMPMYGFGSKSLAGSAKIAYHYLPYSDKIQSIDFSMKAIQYAANETTDFQRLHSQVRVVLKAKDQHSRTFSAFYLNHFLASDYANLLKGIDAEYVSLFKLSFFHHNNKKKAFSVSADLEANEEFAKLSASTTYEIPYTKKASVRFRAFGGSFLYQVDNLSPFYMWSLSGTNGMNDYTYEYNSLARFEPYTATNTLSHQFVATEGAFVSNSYRVSNEWILAVGVEVDLPVLPKKNNIQWFANGAMMSDQAYNLSGTLNETMFWETGLSFSMINNAFKIYIPLLMSTDLNSEMELQNVGLFERVRFTLHLNKLNPFSLARSIF